MEPSVISLAAPKEAAPQAFSAPFDPAKGFKPAQPNLTEIFLQIAGSLEATGSPESYIRHMQAEHKRVSALFSQKTGKPHNSRMPSHLTDEYLDRVIRNWNTLSKPLGLDAFAKDVGDLTREGIMGTRLTGTTAVAMFNEHQKQVAAKMSGRSADGADFEALRKRFLTDLEYGTNVSTKGYETSRRDAVSYASIIDDRFVKLFKKIDAAFKPEKTATVKEVVSGIFLDLGYLAQSELEIAILESAIERM